MYITNTATTILITAPGKKEMMHYRPKFRLELNFQFSPNLVKLIFFDLLVWQELVLIPKIPKSLEHPLT